MKTISAVIVGFGPSGSVFHAPFIAAVPRLRLHGVVTSRAAIVHATYPDVQIYADPQQAFDDPQVDLVIVATPNETHFDLARDALLAGKHVIVEKPFASSWREATELDALARQCRRHVIPFHNRRWDGDFRTVKRLLNEGRLGKVHYLESRLEVWRTDYALDGPDALFDKGPHLIDQALQLFGMPQSVSADARIERAAAQVPDFFHVVMRYPGVIAVLNASLANHHSTTRFFLHGDLASFVKRGIDGQGAAIRAGQRPLASDWLCDRPEDHGMLYREGFAPETITTERGDYRLFYEGVADALLADAAPPVTAAEACDVMRVIEACAQSARTGNAVWL